MEKQRTNKAIYWFIFLLSAVGLAIAVYTHFEWLTLILPVVTTSFVKAMDII